MSEWRRGLQPPSRTPSAVSRPHGLLPAEAGGIFVSGYWSFRVLGLVHLPWWRAASSAWRGLGTESCPGRQASLSTGASLPSLDSGVRSLTHCMSPCFDSLPENRLTRGSQDREPDDDVRAHALHGLSERLCGAGGQRWAGPLEEHRPSPPPRWNAGRRPPGAHREAEGPCSREGRQFAV